MVWAGGPFLLDTVWGPHPDFPRTFYGLDGGVTAIFPLVLLLAGSVVGQQLAQWLPFIAFFPIAVVGMNRLVDGPLVARLGGGLFYALTPIVFDRVWVGHGGYLIGYALLPFVLRSMWSAVDEGGRSWARAGAWTALATAAGPHYIWICIVLLVGVVVVRRPTKDLIAGAALVVMIAGLCSAYLLPSSRTSQGGFTVDQRDLGAYATRPSDGDNLFVTIATLRGFWRVDLQQPQNNFGGRQILLAAGLLIGALGAFALFRKDRRRLAGLLISAAVAMALAAGAKGPTGFLFDWAFDHVPGFAIMREPQKFSAVIAIVGAYVFGEGLARLRDSGSAARLGVVGPAVAAVAIPLALSPGMFWGYGGKLNGGGEYPASWAELNKQLGKGDGAILALPWHLYAGYPFLGGRVIANPSPVIFDREVIAGDNAELPGLSTSSTSPRSAYLSYLYGLGPRIHTFGALVAPLNVRYVLLATSADYTSYKWLENQSDLTPIARTGDFVVYQNQKWAGSNYTVEQPLEVSDWGALVAYSERNETVEGVVVRNVGPGAFTDGDGTDAQPPPAVVARNSAERTSPIDYRVDSSVNKSTIITAEPFSEQWKTKHGEIFQTPQGTVGITADAARLQIKYEPWPRYLFAYVVAVLAAITTCCVCVFNHSKRSSLAQLFLRRRVA